MIMETVSKNKLIFFVILIVLNILLIAGSAFFVHNSIIKIVFVVIRAISFIPIIIFVNNRKGLPITLIAMLIVDFLFLRVFDVYSFIEQNNFNQIGGMILFVYAIFRLLLSVFIITGFFFLNYSKKIIGSSKLKKILSILTIIASILLMFFSFSFSISEYGWVQIVTLVLGLLIPIIFSTALIVCFSGYLTTIQSNVPSLKQAKPNVSASQKIKEKNIVSNEDSRFTGSTFGLVWLYVWTNFVTIITFGIAFTFMLCKREKWITTHTYINGRQLTFDGTGMQLFGKWIKLVLLAIITIGIYAFFIPVAIKKWTVSHTKFSK